jgi:hypothetical protein
MAEVGKSGEGRGSDRHEHQHDLPHLEQPRRAMVHSVASIRVVNSPTSNEYQTLGYDSLYTYNMLSLPMIPPRAVSFLDNLVIHE